MSHYKLTNYSSGTLSESVASTSTTWTYSSGSSSSPIHPQYVPIYTNNNNLTINTDYSTWTNVNMPCVVDPQPDCYYVWDHASQTLVTKKFDTFVGLWRRFCANML